MVGSPRLRVHEGVMGCGGVVVCHRNVRVRGVRGRSVGVYAHLILPLVLTPLIRGRPRARCLHRRPRRPRSTRAGGAGGSRSLPIDSMLDPKPAAAPRFLVGA